MIRICPKLARVFAQCIFKISWSRFVVHEITSVSGESELFPVGIGQVQRNIIKTHGTSCYVNGELISRRYLKKSKTMKKSKISSKSTYLFSILSQALSYILKL